MSVVIVEYAFAFDHPDVTNDAEAVLFGQRYVNEAVRSAVVSYLRANGFPAVQVGQRPDYYRYGSLETKGVVRVLTDVKEQVPEIREKFEKLDWFWDRIQISLNTQTGKRLHWKTHGGGVAYVGDVITVPPQYEYGYVTDDPPPPLPDVPIAKRVGTGVVLLVGACFLAAALWSLAQGFLSKWDQERSDLRLNERLQAIDLRLNALDDAFVGLDRRLDTLERPRSAEPPQPPPARPPRTCPDSRRVSVVRGGEFGFQSQNLCLR